MSTEEKNELKKSSYTEAMRYIENAKEALHKAGREGKYYTDAKYVRTASGVAYSGMLLAPPKELTFEILMVGARKKLASVVSTGNPNCPA